jgi:hypothetical protein
VRKFALGRPLSEMEMAEVAHLLPAAVLADPPPFVVEYRREIPDYAAEIGVSKRTVYRWRDIGIETRDPVPLDNPGQILAWWARRFDREVPGHLVKWAANHASAGQGDAAAVSPPASKAPSPAAEDDEPGDTQKVQRQAIDLKGLSGMGLEASVQLLRQTVEANSKLLATALANPNDDALAHYQGRYEKSVEQLRKAESALFQFQKLRGDLAPRTEFRADLVAMLTGLRGMGRRRADNLTSAVGKAIASLQLAPAVAAQILGAVRAAATAEAEKDEQQLRSARFWKTSPAGEVEPRAA